MQNLVWQWSPFWTERSNRGSPKLSNSDLVDNCFFIFRCCFSSSSFSFECRINEVSSHRNWIFKAREECWFFRQEEMVNLYCYLSMKLHKIWRRIGFNGCKLPLHSTHRWCDVQHIIQSIIHYSFIGNNWNDRGSILMSEWPPFVIRSEADIRDERFIGVSVCVECEKTDLAMPLSW